MIKSFTHNNSHISKLLLLVLVVLISVLCFTPIAIFIGDLTARLGGSTSTVLKVTQIISSVGIMIVPSFIFISLIKQKASSYLYLSKPFSLRQFLLTNVVYFASVPFVTGLTILNQNIYLPERWHSLESYILESEQKIELLTYQMLDLSAPYSWITNFLVIAVVAGLSEEILFRGTLQRILTSSMKRTWLAILITNIIFSFIHFQFFGFIPRLALGIILSLIVLRTYNLWLAIYAHTLNNTMALIEIHFDMKDSFLDCILNLSPAYSILIYAASFSLTVFAISKLKVRSRE